MSRLAIPDRGLLMSPGFWLHHAALAWRQVFDRRLRPLNVTPTLFMLPASAGWPTRLLLTSERAPNGIRTRAAALKGRCPRPLDDGGAVGFGRRGRHQPAVGDRPSIGEDTKCQQRGSTAGKSAEVRHHAGAATNAAC
jgi:hypothetical protein